MTTRFPCILVGVDGREGGRDAIALARVMAGPETRIVLGHAWTLDALLLEDHTEAATAMLERERAAADVEAELDTCGHRTTLLALEELVERHRPDLVVLGVSHRSPVGRLLLGDLARSALHRLRSPVAFVPRGYASDPSPLRVIGAAWHDTPDSDPALELAQQLADDRGAHLRALTVVTPAHAGLVRPAAAFVVVGLQQAGIELAKERFEGMPDVDGRVTTGVPGYSLRDFSKEVDLLVMGSRGRGAARRLIFGSAGDELLHHAACPVLVLPPPQEPGVGLRPLAVRSGSV